MRQKSKPRKYVPHALKLKGKQQPVAILDDETNQDTEPMVTANEQEQQQHMVDEQDQQQHLVDEQEQQQHLVGEKDQQQQHLVGEQEQQQHLVGETEEIVEGDNDEHEPTDEEESESEEDVDTDDLVESDEDENDDENLGEDDEHGGDEEDEEHQGENNDENQGEDEEADQASFDNTKKKRRRVSAYQRSCKQIAAIREEQRRTDLCISHAVMNRTIREIASDYRQELHFEADAIEMLHHISEDLLVQIFHNSNNLAIHANKQSIDPSDMKLALLSNDAWKYLYTPSDSNKQRKYW